MREDAALHIVIQFALSDRIMANCADKTCHGEYYPPKNCAHNIQENFHPSPMTAFAGIFVQPDDTRYASPRRVVRTHMGR